MVSRGIQGRSRRIPAGASATLRFADMCPVCVQEGACISQTCELGLHYPQVSAVFGWLFIRRTRVFGTGIRRFESCRPSQSSHREVIAQQGSRTYAALDGRDFPQADDAGCAGDHAFQHGRRVRCRLGFDGCGFRRALRRPSEAGRWSVHSQGALCRLCGLACRRHVDGSLRTSSSPPPRRPGRAVACRTGAGHRHAPSEAGLKLENSTSHLSI